MRDEWWAILLQPLTLSRLFLRMYRRLIARSKWRIVGPTAIGFWIRFYPLFDGLIQHSMYRYIVVVNIKCSSVKLFREKYVIQAKLMLHMSDWCIETRRWLHDDQLTSSPDLSVSLISCPSPYGFLKFLSSASATVGPDAATASLVPRNRSFETLHHHCTAFRTCWETIKRDGGNLKYILPRNQLYFL